MTCLQYTFIEHAISHATDLCIQEYSTGDCSYATTHYFSIFLFIKNNKLGNVHNFYDLVCSSSEISIKHVR